MSKLADQLRLRHIHNNFGLLSRLGVTDDVVVDYRNPSRGRPGWGESKHTTVWSPRKTDKLPKQEGVKSLFGPPVSKVFFGKRSESLPVALEWARKTFGHELVPSPFGGFIPQRVLERAKAIVKSTA